MQGDLYGFNKRIIYRRIYTYKGFSLYQPSGDITVLLLASLWCFPSTSHLISAAGFEGAVLQLSGTGSPTRASDGPDITTWDGATGRNNNSFIY